MHRLLDKTSTGNGFDPFPGLRVAKARDKYDGDSVLCPQAVGEFDAIQIGKTDIEDGGRRPHLPRKPQRLARCRGDTSDPESFAFEKGLKVKSDEDLIFGNEDAGRLIQLFSPCKRFDIDYGSRPAATHRQNAGEQQPCVARNGPAYLC